jgi:hypothetical protein
MSIMSITMWYEADLFTPVPRRGEPKYGPGIRLAVRLSLNRLPENHLQF